MHKSPKIAWLPMSLAVGLTAPASWAQEVTFPQDQDSWYIDSAAMLERRLAVKPILKPAKNVILMIGDGMGPNTVFAARVFDGQSMGKQGEEHVLEFEKFPHVAYSKTYNTNAQTPDSAGTASAMMTGVKTKAGVFGITDAAARRNCAEALANPATNLAELAEAAGMATGIVTTTRLTHATPGAFYAHTGDRGWEYDGKIPDDAKGKCIDIAAQLIDFPYGDGIDVAMGGGRRNFIGQDDADPEDEGKAGKRTDGRNLINDWAALSNNHIVVQNQADFDAIDINSGPSVLGLFDRSHMAYEADRANDTGGEPSLAEMTGKAIELLSQEENGYVLVVEGGRIDHASHDENAYRTLTDAQAFNAAVAKARAMTDEQDTLIIVTADHGHVLTLQGWAQRGNPILGLVSDINTDGSAKTEPSLGADGKPYTVLTFGNGANSAFGEDKPPALREDLSDVDTTAPDYLQASQIPLGYESHGAQDVGIYASGPKAYLVDGVVEQNYIFHVINYALDLRKRAGAL
jgi:alkaline phosphatase